jgi:hypothetical protein
MKKIFIFFVIIISIASCVKKEKKKPLPVTTGRWVLTSFFIDNVDVLDSFKKNGIVYCSYYMIEKGIGGDPYYYPYDVYNILHDDCNGKDVVIGSSLCKVADWPFVAFRYFTYPFAYQVYVPTDWDKEYKITYDDNSMQWVTIKSVQVYKLGFSRPQ